MILVGRITAIVPWSLWILAPAVHCADDKLKEADLYIPGWNSRSWSDIRGSMISSNDDTAEYTVFCGNPPNCNIAGEVPMIFTEGPDTLIFHGTLASTFIANLECDLEGTTEATCSGYTSCKSGYTAGLCTGPDEITWTSTFSGSEIHWAKVPLTDKIITTDSLDLTATAPDTKVTSVNTEDMVVGFPSSDTIFPQETAPTGGGSKLSGRWTMGAAVVAVMLAGHVL